MRSLRKCIENIYRSVRRCIEKEDQGVSLVQPNNRGTFNLSILLEEGHPTRKTEEWPERQKTERNRYDRREKGQV